MVFDSSLNFSLAIAIMNRKGWIIVGVVVVVVVLAIAIPCALLLGKDDDDKPKTLRERAIAALEDVPLIDGSVLVVNSILFRTRNLN